MTATLTAPKPAATAPVKIQGALFAVEGHAAQTVKQIMDATGLSRSTINSTLAKLAGAGDVIRFDLNGTVTWALTPAKKATLKKAAAKAAPRTVKVGRVTDTGSATTGKAKMTTNSKPSKKAVPASEGNGTVTANADSTDGAARRPRGELKSLILAKLASEGPMGTYAMHVALDVPHGSTYNTMVKMFKDGELVKATEAPKITYRAA